MLTLNDFYEQFTDEELAIIVDLWNIDTGQKIHCGHVPFLSLKAVTTLLQEWTKGKGRMYRFGDPAKQASSSKLALIGAHGSINATWGSLTGLRDKLLGFSTQRVADETQMESR